MINLTDSINIRLTQSGAVDIFEKQLLRAVAKVRRDDPGRLSRRLLDHHRETGLLLGYEAAALSGHMRTEWWSAITPFETEVREVMTIVSICDRPGKDEHVVRNRSFPEGFGYKVEKHG